MTKLVSKTRAWKKVAAHYKHFKDVEMRDLFDDDKNGLKNLPLISTI